MHKSHFYYFFMLLFIISSCSDSSDNLSGNSMDYKLGAIGAFSEMVDSGVKQLGLSGVMSKEEMDVFLPMALEIASRNHVQVYREADLIVTDLFPADVAEDKEVLLIYRGNTKDAYMTLKADKQRLVAAGEYKEQERLEIARRFGRLLSYTPQRIDQLLGQNTSFRTLSDFGIRASNVFLYYDDLPRATAFYIQVLGLELVSEYDNASIMRVATSSYIILVDAAKGMHSADEPKTVAIALLTDQLTQWYDHLQDKGVEIKYTYKPKDGGPHDGFVAIDPEGYLLEFELFKQHPENERLIPILDHNESIPVKLGNGLSFNATITWLYYKDMMKMKSFFETTLGLEQIVDQGWAEVYKVTNSGFIGLVDERRGMHKFTEDKAVTVSFIIDELDAWYDYVSSTSAFPLKSESVSEGPDGKYRAFVGYDPEGYFLEFDKFYEHPDNTVLLDYLGSK